MAGRIPPRRGGRSAYSKISVLNPGKGLNNLISDNLINDQESSSLENIQFVESGAPAKAYGYTNVGSGLSNNPRGLGFYNDTTNSARYLLTVDGTALKYLNGTTWTSIAGASFDASSQINMTQASGNLYIWDGVSGGCQLAATTLSRPGTMPKARFSVYYSGYHCAAGVDGQLNRLYISVLTDSSDFTNAATTLNNSTEVPGATVFAGSGANFVDINKNDGDKITGLAKFQDALIIFKERSVFQMTFDSTGTPIIAAVSKTFGAVSHRSVENVENDVFFLSRNGVYVLGNEPNYFNVIRTNELSSRIHPVIETINPTNYTGTTAIFNQYVYYLGIPAGGVTANNQTLTYDRRFQAWSKLTHIMPECFTVYTDSTNTDSVYFTSSNSANVYKFTTNYDSNGSAISAQWTSKAFDLQEFSLYKRWIWVDILFRQLVGTVTIQVITDNGTITKTTTVASSSIGGMGSYSLGGGDWLGGTVESSSGGTTQVSTNIPYRVKLSTKSRTIKIRVSNARTNETFVVLGLEFGFRKYSAFVFPSSQKLQ